MRQAIQALMTRLRNAIVPPEIQLLSLLGGINVSLVIKTAFELDLFDSLARGPARLHELATQMQCSEASLERFLKTVVSIGLIEATPDGLYRLSASGELLVDGDRTLAPLARYILSDALVTPMMNLKHSIQHNEASFNEAMGSDWYGYGLREPKHLAVMDAAMQNYSRLGIPALLGAFAFSGYRTVVDIAGGKGHVLAAILAANPESKGILFDQPATIRRAAETFENAHLMSRVELVGGDMFESVPTGGDLYLINKTLNDWDDAHVLSVLRNVRKAMNATSRLVLVEIVSDSANPPVHDSVRDLCLLACTGGRTRTRSEFESLLTRSGFALDSITATKGPFKIAGLMAVGPAFSVLECTPAPRYHHVASSQLSLARSHAPLQ